MTLSPTTPTLEFAPEMVERVNAALEAYLDGLDCPSRLAEAVRYSLLAPGKRLRPMLVLLAAEACGYDPQAAMPAACAVEMIHAYSLIHDDLPAMDDDDLRRGRPTCHVQFDEATAILAGDALLTQAFAVLAGANWAEDIRSRCVAELAQAAGTAGMVGGQADDLAAEQSDTGDLQQLISIHRRKTGAMIRVSLRLGATVAGASEQELNALTSYGEKIGLAFQIADDLLDHNGDEQALGKRTNKDAGRGKLTFPVLLGADEARGRADSLIAEAVDAISLFEDRATKLELLANFVIVRTN